MRLFKCVILIFASSWTGNSILPNYLPNWHNHILSNCTENKETIVLPEKQKEKKIPLAIVINKKFVPYFDKNNC